MQALLSVLLLLIISLQALAAEATSNLTRGVEEVGLTVAKSSFIVPPDEMPTPLCHAATLVESAPGELMAAWYGGSRQGAQDVRIWGANYRDGQWYAPRQLTESLLDNTGAHWDPVLFSQDGLLHLYFRVGKSPRLWQGYHQISPDHGYSWTSAQLQFQDFHGPIRNQPLVLSEGRTLYPSSTEYHGWQAHIEVEDRQNMSRAVLPDPLRLGAIQPALLDHGDCVVQALCRTRSGIIAQSHSQDCGDSWSELEATSLLNPSAGIGAITLRNGLHLLIYNPVTTGRSPLVAALSDDGQNWHHQLTLEDSEGEFSYPALIEADNGSIHIAYTWHRKAIRHVELELN